MAEEVKNVQTEETPSTDTTAGGESGGTPVAPVESGQVEPQQTAPVEPQVSPTEVSWLRQRVNQMEEYIRQKEAELREWELASLDDDERVERELEYARAENQRLQQAMQGQQYLAEWYRYYSGFVPEGTLVGDDPLAWQEAVLNYQQNQNKKLVEQVEALKKELAAKQPKPTQTSSPGGSPVGAKPLAAMTREEREAFRRKIRLGQIGPEDFPPIAQ